MPLLPCAGKLPIRTGIYTNTSFPLDDLYRVFLPASVGCLPENETTFATPFKNAGYYTALGAW
jgi:arylsulfatase A-like enzyme